MKEAKFNTEIVNSLKDCGAWAYKIPDMPSSLMVGGRFNPDKPCDIIACVRSRFVGIEGKMLRDYKAISLSLFRDNQVQSLDAMVEASGLAFAFINIRITESPRVNKLIIINWSKWRDTLKERTVPKRTVMTLPYIQGTKGRFDLSDFCKLVGQGICTGFSPRHYKEDLIERRTRK
jgi:hypothetical protein